MWVFASTRFRNSHWNLQIESPAKIGLNSASGGSWRSSRWNGPRMDRMHDHLIIVVEGPRSPAVPHPAFVENQDIFLYYYY